MLHILCLFSYLSLPADRLPSLSVDQIHLINIWVTGMFSFYSNDLFHLNLYEFWGYIFGVKKAVRMLVDINVLSCWLDSWKCVLIKYPAVNLAPNSHVVLTYNEFGVGKKL